MKLDYGKSQSPLPQSGGSAYIEQTNGEDQAYREIVTAGLLDGKDNKGEKEKSATGQAEDSDPAGGRREDTEICVIVNLPRSLDLAGNLTIGIDPVRDRTWQAACRPQRSLRAETRRVDCLRSASTSYVRFHWGIAYIRLCMGSLQGSGKVQGRCVVRLPWRTRGIAFVATSKFCRPLSPTLIERSWRFVLPTWLALIAYGSYGGAPLSFPSDSDRLLWAPDTLQSREGRQMRLVSGEGMQRGTICRHVGAMFVIHGQGMAVSMRHSG